VDASAAPQVSAVVMAPVTKSYEVCATGAPYTDIQSAVDDAVDGDLIEICPGVYDGVEIDQADVEIRGDHPDLTLIDGGAFAPAIRVETQAVLVSGVTLTGSPVVLGSAGALEAAAGAQVTVRNASTSNTNDGGVGAYVIHHTDSVITLDHVLIEGNETGIPLHDGVGGSIDITNCVLRNNFSTAQLWNLVALDATIQNNLVYDNENGPAAEGLRVDDSNGAFDIIVANNTVAENTFPLLAFGVGGNATEFRNNIIANHGSSEGLASTSVVDYNDVWGHTTNYNSLIALGVGNIEFDPQFTDAVSDDYSLDSGSPCIDSGDPDPSANDPDGSPNDMGAFGGPLGGWSPPD
jgi:hypothetical protein